MNQQPWCEKYRPTNFNDIVLDEYNKLLLENCIKMNNFPNLLFYGPPGTGKTTTIINLINKYQEKYNEKHKGLKIHLNASDDRGIEIIRNQINSFVNTKSLFGKGLKFVILDEVDYMTKNAQQALRYLIQQYSDNIRFCLICNYISKIDNSLQNEFIKLRFSQLPKKEIFKFLKNIVKREKLKIDDNQINLILEVYKSDIRSMINFIQCNHDNDGLNVKIIKNEDWVELISIIKSKDKGCINYIKKVCIEYNIDIKTFILEFLFYIILNFKVKYDDMLNIEFICHSNINENYILDYTLNNFQNLFKSS
tara:strand:- start:6269 stop:7192 length:924 start_codon:yes stop_codon:yes gene_type:complete